MSVRTPVLLLERATRQTVPAWLIEDVTEAEIVATDDVWRPFLEQKVTEALAQGVSLTGLPEHTHWDWPRKYRHRGADSRFFGIECDGEMQALMETRLDKRARLPEQRGLSLVYVDYLATAPWNLPELVVSPRYRGGGSLLIATAVQLSLSLGWDGRIGLHALEQAEVFYSGTCGMTDLGQDDNYFGLRYFELAADQTPRFQEKREQ